MTDNTLPDFSACGGENSVVRNPPARIALLIGFLVALYAYAPVAQAAPVVIGAGRTVTIPGDQTSPEVVGDALTINGNMNIEAGGEASYTIGYIGYNAGSSGAILVTGSGSAWNNSSNLYVGQSGRGSLIIAGNRAVSATNRVVLAEESGSGGTLAVTAGGTLRALALSAGAGSASATFSCHRQYSRAYRRGDNQYWRQRRPDAQRH